MIIDSSFQCDAIMWSRDIVTFVGIVISFILATLTVYGIFVFKKDGKKGTLVISLILLVIIILIVLLYRYITSTTPHMSFFPCLFPNH